MVEGADFIQITYLKHVLQASVVRSFTKKIIGDAIGYTPKHALGGAPAIDGGRLTIDCMTTAVVPLVHEMVASMIGGEPVVAA